MLSFQKCLLLPIFMIAGLNTVAAEDKKEDFPMDMFQMHYMNRTASFALENTQYSKIVLLGDSITEGFKVEKHFPFHRILNRGIGADVIGVGQKKGDRRGVLKRLHSSVYDCGTSHVFVMIGINDMGDSRPLEVMNDGYSQILENIRTNAPMVTVHVQSLLPTSKQRADWNPRIREFNKMLQSLAAKFSCSYVDLNSLFADEKGELRAELTDDGLHINDKGYTIWKQAIEKEMGWSASQ